MCHNSRTHSTAYLDFGEELKQIFTAAWAVGASVLIVNISTDSISHIAMS